MFLGPILFSEIVFVWLHVYISIYIIESVCLFVRGKRQCSRSSVKHACLYILIELARHARMCKNLYMYVCIYISVKMAAPWGFVDFTKLLFAMSSLAQPLKRVRSIPEHFFVILSQCKTCAGRFRVT